jgi:hypothetical protein
MGFDLAASVWYYLLENLSVTYYYSFCFLVVVVVEMAMDMYV